MNSQKFAYTVHCFTDKRKTQHFRNIGEAVGYANRLLSYGFQCKIYDYRPPRKYIDIVAERGPNG